MICSKGCGIADIIDGQAGLAVPYNKDDFEKAIKLILGDSKLRDKFSHGSNLILENEFNLSKVVDEIEDLYREIA